MLTVDMTAVFEKAAQGGEWYRDALMRGGRTRTRIQKIVQGEVAYQVGVWIWCFVLKSMY